MTSHPPFLTSSELQKFSLCRLYLQVITLSDITISSGTEIDIHFWKGNRSLHTYSLKWPQQTRLSPQCWAIWRRTLNLLFTSSHKSNDLLKAHHLYHWLPHSPSHQKWPTLIDPLTLLLYSRKPGNPHLYSIFIPRYRFSYTSTGTTTPSLPSCSVLITVTHWLPFAATTHFFSKHQPSSSPLACPSPSSKSHNYNNYLRIPYTGQVPSQPPHATTPPLPPPQASCKFFYTFLATLSSSKQFFLGCHSLPPNLQHFISDIHSNKFTMASDGSVRAPNGSFAWVIFGIASKTHWSGHNTIAKGHSDLSSFRTEACGYLGVLYALQAILTAFPLPRNSPLIYTTIRIDNSGVVNRSSNTPFSIQQCLLLTRISSMRPCKSVSLFLEPSRYNISKATRTVTQTLPRLSPYQQGSICWQMQKPTKHIQPTPFSTKLPSYPPHQWH